MFVSMFMVFFLKSYLSLRRPVFIVLTSVSDVVGEDSLVRESARSRIVLSCLMLTQWFIMKLLIAPMYAVIQLVFSYFLNNRIGISFL